MGGMLYRKRAGSVASVAVVARQSAAKAGEARGVALGVSTRVE